MKHTAVLPFPSVVKQYSSLTMCWDPLGSERERRVNTLWGGDDIRDPDPREAPEGSQEGHRILPGEGGVREGFLEEGGPTLSVSIFNFYWFPKT